MLCDPKNYRPVSLTSLCSNVMEHIVCSEVSRHLSSNNIVTPHQHGFRRGLSCETQLVSVIHEWSKILDTHGQVDIIFLDLAKAFDSVPHERLLLKASYYGIRGKLHTWLRCFLTERKQRVVVNGTSSDWSAVSSGVPQGTVLFVYRQIQRVEDHSILQQDLFNLEQWASLWQINFAPSKCYTLSVTLKKEPSLFTYSLCKSILEGVKFQKYLGVYITSSLSWAKQCEAVKKKANRVLGVLQRSLSSCSESVKERAYVGLVRPIAEYASAAWSPHTKKDTNNIESIQRRAARFVRGDYSRTSSVSSITRELGWASLQSRRTVHDLTLFYKIHSGAVIIQFPLNSFPPYAEPGPANNIIELSFIRALLWTLISTLFLYELYPTGILSLPQS